MLSYRSLHKPSGNYQVFYMGRWYHKANKEKINKLLQKVFWDQINNVESSADAFYTDDDRGDCEPVNCYDSGISDDVRFPDFQGNQDDSSADNYCSEDDSDDCNDYDNYNESETSNEANNSQKKRLV